LVVSAALPTKAQRKNPPDSLVKVLPSGFGSFLPENLVYEQVGVLECHDERSLPPLTFGPNKSGKHFGRRMENPSDSRELSDGL